MHSGIFRGTGAPTLGAGQLEGWVFESRKFKDQRMSRIFSYLKDNVWSALSLLISGYFFWAFHLHVEFPPTVSLTYTSSTYLGLFTFFVVLPFAQRLKIGKLIEFEKKVEKVEEDVQEVRSETEELTSSVGVVARTISPSLRRHLTTTEEVSGDFTPSQSTDQNQKIREYLEADHSNVIYALGRLRMDLERELRRILGEPAVVIDAPLRKRGRAAVLTARLLFRQLESRNARYGGMQRSFDYVIEHCNGAVHGQQITEDIAHEVIDMGLRILEELKKETGNSIDSVIGGQS